MKTITELIDDFNEQNQRNLIYYEQDQLVMENRNVVMLILNFESHFQANKNWNPKDYGLLAINKTEKIIELIIEIESILVDQEAEKEGLLNQKNGVYYPAGLGVCHSVWAMKRSSLRRKYGIIWQSPAELNPTILFD